MLKANVLMTSAFFSVVELVKKKVEDKMLSQLLPGQIITVK
jgi:hypothetical protein